MMDQKKITCNNHGEQDQTFVCQHIVHALNSGQPVGFHWPKNSDQKRPDAWCTNCEKKRLEQGDEWTENCNDYLQVKLLCAACYDQAKMQNGF